MFKKRLAVYILECADGKYYVGVTNNIDRRLAEHNSGKDPRAFTCKRRPVKLVFLEVFDSPREAIAYEKQIKDSTRAKKQALIERNWAKLSALAVCQNDSKAKRVKK